MNQKVKLYVVNTFDHYEEHRCEMGIFALIHPQMLLEQQDILFGYFSPNHKVAVKALQAPMNAEILNRLFGVDNWEVEFKAITLENKADKVEEFIDSLDKASANERIDTANLKIKLEEARINIVRERTN